MPLKTCGAEHQGLWNRLLLRSRPLIVACKGSDIAVIEIAAPLPKFESESLTLPQNLHVVSLTVQLPSRFSCRMPLHAEVQFGLVDVGFLAFATILSLTVLVDGRQLATV